MPSIFCSRFRKYVCTAVILHSVFTCQSSGEIYYTSTGFYIILHVKVRGGLCNEHYYHIAAGKYTILTCKK